MLRNPLRRRTLKDLRQVLPRDFLVRRSRILFIDDERPELIDDLEKAQFAVNYEPDIEAAGQHALEPGHYDLLVLDYGGVGSYFGQHQGLSLLRHVKDVNPSLVIVAYTSKHLPAGQSDFYREADFVLGKDAGVRESRELIEDALRKARGIENAWSGLLASSGITPGSKEDLQLQHEYVKLKEKGSLDRFGAKVDAVLGSQASPVVSNVVGKLVEAGVAAILG